MKNVAIISPSLHGGGAECVAGLLSKELSKHYNVYLFLVCLDNIVYDYGGELVDIGGNDPFFEERIKEYKKLYQIDISISFMEPFNFANVRTRLNEKVILSEQCPQSQIETGIQSQELQIRRYYNCADEIVTVSEGVKYDLDKNYGINTKMTTIYNPIDKQKILYGSEKSLPEEVKNFLNGKEYFMNAGRLVLQKNQKRLIFQYAHYRQSVDGNQKKLIILGSGPLEAELKNYISELGLEQDIKIVSYTSNPFVFMKNAFAFVLSSQYEGMGNVILESMQVGCPVISSDCFAGPRELILPECDYSKVISKIEIGENGILVCNDSTEDCGKSFYLSEAMIMLENDRELYLKLQRNAVDFADTFTVSKIVRQWIEIIERPYSGKKKDGLHTDRMILDKAKHLFIFGAGVVGKKSYACLNGKYKIEGFLVSKRGDDEKCMDLPVLEVSDLKYSKEDVTVIIGVSDLYADDVVRLLLENGFDQFVYPFL